MEKRLRRECPATHPRRRRCPAGLSFRHRQPTRLNVKLPIPFNDWSEMEADLFCSGLKLAIEIDGPQHLADPAAYRRKDALLVEHGCLVLRFLAEDLSKHLDATLDAIHRPVDHKRMARLK